MLFDVVGDVRGPTAALPFVIKSSLGQTPAIPAAEMSPRKPHTPLMVPPKFSQRHIARGSCRELLFPVSPK